MLHKLLRGTFEPTRVSGTFDVLTPQSFQKCAWEQLFNAMDPGVGLFDKSPYAGDVSALALLSWPVRLEAAHQKRNAERVSGSNSNEAASHQTNDAKGGAKDGSEKVTLEGETRSCGTGIAQKMQLLKTNGVWRETQTLLAGMGSQVLWYDLQSGALLLAHSVFDGVRVHGIHVRTPHHTTFRTTPSTLTEAVSPPSALLAVFGEKRVKILELSGDALVRSGGTSAGIKLVQVLPRFSSWVFDARFLLESDPKGALAVGLGNNSVSLWDWKARVEMRRVQCSVECLLYSMALHGDTLAELAVVAGTIYNEVLVWKCESSRTAPSRSLSTSQVEPIHTLKGHEGSIHRVSWASDGSQVMSVSDDRSACVWNVGFDGSGPKASAGPILYGHTARIWDCIVTEQFIVTASEDCTCRIWTSDGQLASVVRGHSGRGVWRVLFEPSICALITGGADSAIKMHPMREVLSRIKVGGSEKGSQEEESFVLRNGPENLRKKGTTKKEMTSKSEYVRCLTVVGSDYIYVATNQGYLYRVNLAGEHDTWRPLIDQKSEPGGPIVSLAVRLSDPFLDEGSEEVSQEQVSREDASEATQNLASAGERSPSENMIRDRRKRQMHCVLWGDHLGRATAAYFDCGKRRQNNSSLLRNAAELKGEECHSANKQSLQCGSSSVELQAERENESNKDHSTSESGGTLELRRCQWQAHEARKLLGVFWADALGCEHAFTTDAVGRVSWWRVDNKTRGSGATLLGTCQSPFWIRVLSLTVDAERQNLLCGDQKGNLVAFSLSAGDQKAQELPLMGALKAAHGISAIPMVAVDSDGAHDRTVTTVGRDGCICTHLLQPRPEMMTSARVLASKERREKNGCRGNEPKLIDGKEAGQDLVCSSENELSKAGGQMGSSGSPPEPARRSVSNEADRVKSSVWLTCTKVERVSCMPSIEWTGSEITQDHLHVGSTSNSRRLAAGFSSTEFVVWDLEQQSEVVRVPCGGWHRPHSFWIGRPNESGVKTCFAYVKNDELQVHRKGCLERGSRSESAGDRLTGKEGFLVATKVLHPAFHGKELHCAEFLPAPKGWENCVLTGGEDGSLRMTRFSGGKEPFNFSSAALGEHVRGAAIRACAVVPDSKPRAVNEQEAKDVGPCVVFTAGAKEVLTAWLHAWEPKTGPHTKALPADEAKDKATAELSSGSAKKSPSNRPDCQEGSRLVGFIEGQSASIDKRVEESGCTSVEPEIGHVTGLPIIKKKQEQEWTHSWRWLSTHDGSTEALESKVRTASETSTSKAGPGKRAADKDDQRYLAVTAFSTGAFEDGSLICYVVTASADSKVVLRAFHPHSRSWHVLAHLKHHTCPVLSLDCLTELPLTSQAGSSSKQAFLILSGATDGSIAFWDVTGPVQSFDATWKERVAAVSDQGGNSRPPTGRGSAGGGGWRRLTGPRMSKRSKTKLAKAAASNQFREDEKSAEVDSAATERNESSEAFPQERSESFEGYVDDKRYEGEAKSALVRLETALGDQDSSFSSLLVNQAANLERKSEEWPTDKADESINQTRSEVNGKSLKEPIHSVARLTPVHVIEAAHQSGVNGLSVAHADVQADLADVSKTRGGEYVAVSGGDDQAIHTAHVRVRVNGRDELELEVTAKGSAQLAHSSAVKDVWTDGSYAFSTGLDQRLRCWRLLNPPPHSHSAEDPPGEEPIMKARASSADCSADALLHEVSECVTDVPEAAALSVQKCARGRYSVVVGGRGIQLFSMHVPS